MSSCPRCGSNKTVRNGSVRGVKKRKCKDCNYQLRAPARRPHLAAKVQRLSQVADII